MYMFFPGSCLKNLVIIIKKKLANNARHHFLELRRNVDVSMFVLQDGSNLPILPSQRAPNLYMVPQGIRPVVQLTAIEVCRSLGFIDQVRFHSYRTVLSHRKWILVHIRLLSPTREFVQNFEIFMETEGLLKKKTQVNSSITEEISSSYLLGARRLLDFSCQLEKRKRENRQSSVHMCVCVHAYGCVLSLIHISEPTRPY